MKTLILSVTAGMLIAGSIGANVAQPPVAEGGKITLTTNSGHKYENATLSRIEPDGLVLETEEGIVKVHFAKLPAEIQKQFGFDRKAAAENARRVVDAMKRERARQETLNQQASEAADEAKARIAGSDRPVATNLVAMPEGTKFSLYGKVVQALADGVLVKCEKDPVVTVYKPIEGLVLVRSCFVREGAFVKGDVLTDGYFDYLGPKDVLKRVQAVQLAEK